MNSRNVARVPLKVILIIICALPFFIGCGAKFKDLEKQARLDYSGNRYDRALTNCVMALKINPNYDKAQELVPVVFKAAVDEHEEKIKALGLSQAQFKWDSIVREYETLIQNNKQVKTLPPLVVKKTGGRITFDVKDYTQQLAEAKNNAADQHYQAGILISQDKGIERQKQAAKEFKLAGKFVPGYKDAASRYEEARRAGIKRMAIMPFEDKSGKLGKYGALTETVTDQIISSVMSDPNAMEFLELVSRDQLEQVVREQRLAMTGILDEQTAAKVGQLLGVHEMLIGQVTQILGVPERTTSRKEVQNKTVREQRGTEKYTDKKGNVKERAKFVNVPIAVTVTYYTRTASASIVGSYKIIDAQTAKINKSDSFKIKHDFKAEWATFTGDKRALDRNAQSLTSRTEEIAPTEENMVLEAANKLSNSLASALKAYAR